MHRRSKLITLIASLTLGVVLITGVMLALVANGIINVTSQKLVITSESISAPYTGASVKAPAWTLKDGTLKNGHTLHVNVSGEQTNVGTSENYISVVIKDKNGVDVTTDYEIECIPGTIAVTPREITIIAASTEKVYDGTPLSDPSYKIDPVIAIAADETVEVTVEGAQTAIGQSDNVITSVKITDPSGHSTIHNYNIKTVRGTLTVTGQDTLVFASDSSQMFYNGAALTNNKWSLLSGQLANGDTAVVNVVGSQTEAGTCANDFYVNIQDASGKDVTFRYKIEKRPGTLTVKPQQITITTPDAQKVYDGTPLADPTYEATPLYAEGATLQVSVTGEQTEVGRSPNTVESYIVLDKNNNDITSNYEITVEEGVLFVAASEDGFKNAITVKTFDAQKIYDGMPLTEAGYEVVGDLKSGHSIFVVNTGSQTTAGTSKNFTTVIIFDAQGNAVNDQYTITYKEGTLTVHKCKVTVTSASDSKTYDGTPLKNGDFTVKYTNEEPLGITLTPSIVGSQTEIGMSLNTIDGCTVVNAAGEDITENFDITEVEGTLTVIAVQETVKEHLIVESASDTKIYDALPLTNTNCRILSGTLAAGHIPSYEVSGSQTDVGRSDNTFSLHIRDEAGTDVTDSYTIEYRFGTLAVTARALTLTASSAVKEYDGTPLLRNEFTVSPSHLMDTFIFFATVEGSQTEVGQSDNVITDYWIYDNYGLDVARNFAVTLQKGTLTVTEKEEDTHLIYTSESAEKTYDGTPLYNKNYTRESGELKKGHREEVSLEKSIIDVGKEENTLVVRIVDDLGYDVTSEYTIECFPGTLTVYPVELTLTAASAKKYYDGYALTQPDGFTVTPPNAIPVGAHVTVENVGSQTTVGTSPNHISYWQILDSRHNDISKNFTVTTVDGALTVEPLEITITANSNEKLFNGTPLTDTGYVVSPALPFYSDFTLDVTIEGEILYPGEVPNVITQLRILNSAGDDVSANFIVHTENGTLTVTKAPLTITAKSDTKEYDGQPLTNVGYSLSNRAYIPAGATEIVTIVGSQTDPGTSDNKVIGCTILLAGEDISSYYDITYKNGTLTVTEKIKTVLAIVESDTSGTIYFRTQSYQDYAPGAYTPWRPASPYTALTFDGYNAAYLMALALENAGLTAANITITPLVDSMIGIAPYYTWNAGGAELTESGVNGNLKSAIAMQLYLSSTTAQLPDEYLSYERDYSNYVYANYLDVDATTRELMDEIIRKEGFDATDPNVYTKVASYIQNAAKYNLNYDTDLDSSTNTIVDFLTIYKEGVCRHYASAATALFRALGIPARYVEGFAIEVEAGKTSTITTEGHAWVEVYIDGFGWQYIEVTGSDNSKDNEDNTFVLYPQAVYEKYDEINGELVSAKSELSGDIAKLLQEIRSTYPGATYEATVSGERAKNTAGKTKTNIVDVRFFDALKNDITAWVFDEYPIKYKTSFIQIYYDVLSFGSCDNSKTYDGKPLVTTVDDCYFMNEESLLPGHSYILTPTGSVTNAETKNSTFDVTILDGNGKDITDCYRIIKTMGKLVIEPKAIKFKAGSAEKSYDGTPLTCNELSYDTTELLSGHTVSAYTIVGSVTNPLAKCDNVITYILITDEKGQDVTANYSCTLIPGELKITR